MNFDWCTDSSESDYISDDLSDFDDTSSHFDTFPSSQKQSLQPSKTGLSYLKKSQIRQTISLQPKDLFGDLRTKALTKFKQHLKKRPNVVQVEHVEIESSPLVDREGSVTYKCIGQVEIFDPSKGDVVPANLIDVRYIGQKIGIYLRAMHLNCFIPEVLINKSNTEVDMLKKSLRFNNVEYQIGSTLSVKIEDSQPTKAIVSLV